ncbi:MAG TPA: hypothetical protein EYN79_09705 [Planctomycetes bacterium]|nr:hypothetical protein [Planctomycetota bacterium]HIN81041.1 hypothetical protein [Planctomycetota bacterium]
MKFLRTLFLLVSGGLLVTAPGTVEGAPGNSAGRDKKAAVEKVSLLRSVRGVTPLRTTAVTRNKRAVTPRRVVTKTRSKRTVVPLSTRHFRGSIDRVGTVRCRRNNHVHEFLQGVRFFNRGLQCFRRLSCGRVEFYLPGHYEMVSREIIEPGRWKYLNTRVALPVFGCFPGLLRTQRNRVWIAPRIRVVTERCWVPGAWVETHSLHVS